MSTHAKQKLLTEDEFIENEAAKNKISVSKFKELLRKHGVRVERCTCGHRVCRGWILSDESFLFFNKK